MSMTEMATHEATPRAPLRNWGDVAGPPVICGRGQHTVMFRCRVHVMGLPEDVPIFFVELFGPVLLAHVGHYVRVVRML